MIASLHYQTAIDVQTLPRDVASPRTRQEYRHRRDVLCFAVPADGDALGNAASQLRLLNTEFFGTPGDHIVEKRSGGHARTDGVNVDVMASEAVCTDSGHGYDRALARGVRGIGGSRPSLTCNGRQVDDTSAVSLLDHLTGCSLHAEERSFGVHAMDAIPVIFRYIHELSLPGDRRVVDENVYAAQIPGGVSHDALDISQLAHVRLNGDCAPARLRNLGPGSFNGLTVDVDHGHVCAFLGEEESGRLADPLSRTGHESEFSIEIHLITIIKHRMSEALWDYGPWEF